jgi:hypothetical protein
MPDFPPFMKSPANRIATSSQHTPGVEGYVCLRFLRAMNNSSRIFALSGLSTNRGEDQSDCWLLDAIPQRKGTKIRTKG